MIPSEMETAARQKYNGTNDTFFVAAEIYNWIWQAEMELAAEIFQIEQTSTTSTVASQQDYTWPTNALAIKRLTYSGRKLVSVTMREDDALTLNNMTTTSTGTPQYYWLWNRTISLRPVPDGVGTLKIWTFDAPAVVTSASQVLEIPTVAHMAIVDFLVAQMAAKDTNFSAAEYYMTLWNDHKMRLKAYVRKMKRGDSFAAVQDEETLPQTILGAV